MAFDGTDSRLRRMRGLGVVAAFLMMSALSSVVYSNTADFYTDFCSSCFSEPQFAAAAIDTAPSLTPKSGKVMTYRVYVTNPDTLEARFFEVRVWYEWGDMDPHSSPAPGADGVIGDSNSQQGQGLNKLAVPGPGDVDVIDAHIEAVVAAKTFLSSMEDVDVGDLPYPPGDAPGSAIDLVGSDAATELARNAFRMRVQDYLESNLSSLLGQASDLLERLFNNYIGQSRIFDSIMLDIGFPDGTTIRLKIKDIANIPVAVEAEVLPESARMPDGSAVPQSPSQFSGYEYTGSSGVGQSLLDLLDRLGVTVPNGRPNCDFACPPSGNTLECTLTCRTY